MMNKKEIRQKEYIPPYVSWLNCKFKHIKCDHVWDYGGHGHNSSHYICRKCGSEGDY